MNEFSRITGGVARNRIHSAFVNIFRRNRRQLHPEAELREESKPERIVFVHIEHTRNTDNSPRCFQRNRLVIEQPFKLITIKVWKLAVFFLFTLAALAAIARDEARAVSELIYREHAVVLAAVTACVAVLNLEIIYFGKIYELASYAVVVVLGYYRSAVSAHYAGNIRTHNISSHYAFDTSKYRIIKERTALHYDFFTCFLRVSQLYYLIKRVSDDGVRKTRGNISDGRALFLRLLYLGIHKYRAARTEIYRSLRKQRFLCKIGNTHINRLGICLYERTAAGRARFVEHNAVNRSVSYLHTFHILSADIENKIYTRQEFFSRLIMRHRLYFAIISSDSSFYEAFTITRNRYFLYISAFRYLWVKLAQHHKRRIDRLAVVTAVKRIKQIFFTVYKRSLCRRRACIYAEIKFTGSFCKRLSVYPVRIVSFSKLRIVFLILKKRFQMLRFREHIRLCLFYPGNQFCNRMRLVF